ncbi:VOC family protein [Allopusillimonas soli]|nr:VOC family protein [Allopusillimonas soli]
MENKQDNAGAQKAGHGGVSPIPPDMATVTPHLVCAGAADAIAFYKKAFGAVEKSRLELMPGKIAHAYLRIGDSAIFLMDEVPEWNARGPKMLKGSPVSLHLYVQDVDAATEQAIAAGATVVMPVEDMFWGDRYGVVEDPFGHRWSLATHVQDLTPEEIGRNAQEMMARGGGDGCAGNQDTA